MKEKLLKIINTYGVLPQLKYFQSEVFELNEAIIIREQEEDISSFTDKLEEHIVEEIADVMVMLEQFQHYYGISNEEIKGIMKAKISRQLDRIERGG